MAGTVQKTSGGMASNFKAPCRMQSEKIKRRGAIDHRVTAQKAILPLASFGTLDDSAARTKPPEFDDFLILREGRILSPEVIQ